MSGHGGDGVVQHAGYVIRLGADDVNERVDAGVEERGVAHHAENLSCVALRSQRLGKANRGRNTGAHADGIVERAECVAADVANRNDLFEILFDRVEEAAVRAASTQNRRARRKLDVCLIRLGLLCAGQRFADDLCVEFAADWKLVLAGGVEA